VDARTLTVKDVFSKDIRYVIPMFQRPYVWNEQTHWEPLWEDVRSTADRYLRNLGQADADDTVEAEQRTAPHFLGAIVVDLLAFGTGDVEARHVIDGQQRLTTLQLLLDASQEVLEDVSPGREARLLRKLVLNDPDVAVRPDHRFKVWPTNIDRAAFRTAMENGLDPTPHRGTPIADAHSYFKRRVHSWLSEADDEARPLRVQALNVVLHSRLQLVVIDLEPHDNAQVIFETLNARGTPLLASDLVKNHLLQTAEARGLDVETLYEEKWKRFDRPHWRKEQQQGRLRRPRIDAFLDYWLELRTLDEVAAHSVFPSFRTYLAKQTEDLASTVDDIVRMSDVYDALTSADHPSQAAFLRRWQLLEAQVATPLLLWLFGNEDRMGDKQLARATATLESFLVRRMICRRTTKDYNRLFLDALQELHAGDPADAGDRLTAFFARQTADARLWPSDTDVARAVVTSPMYHHLKRSRLKMLLEVLENDLRTDRSEEPFSPSSKITIEHIIPQAWTPLTWPLEAPDGPRATERRLALIHVLGNLTLVNDKLNPTLSNGPWEAKRPALAKHSVLRLNHEILDDARPWTDSRVVERGIELAKRVVRLWPGPELESVDYDALNPLAQAEAAGGLAAEPEAAERPSTMQQLLDAGLLEPDDLLLWRRPELDEVHEAHVRAGGIIETEDGELYDSPSAAAGHLADGHVNGWQAWRVVRLGDRRLSEVRDELD
jgi:hypothetical protein